MNGSPEEKYSEGYHVAYHRLCCDSGSCLRLQREYQTISRGCGKCRWFEDVSLLFSREGLEPLEVWEEKIQ